MDPLNVGPVQLEWGGVNLGLTSGGCRLTWDEPVFDTTADATGQTPRKRYVIGGNCMARASVTEATLAQIAKICGATVTGGGDRVVLQSRVGVELTSLAETLILKPIIGEEVSTNEEEWIIIPKCTISPRFDVPMVINEQKVWAFEAQGHPVLAADIASGGFLYNSGSPEYAAGDILVFGEDNA